ncbi:MAG: glycosyltransferase family 8 protein [Campylobacteraceae bacterium]|jgi:lipopolysaccharide biosynthesis glycosyltransferase|nr:glycosyltransferase family 8 protein [Campylobacteraceae bacterium]
MDKKMRPKNTIPVVFSSDDNYAPYLGVCIKSLIGHSTPFNNYEIFIIDGGISKNHKNQISSMEIKNISIKFIDIKPFLENIDLSIFSLNSHFTINTYYRFFMPKIFSNYDKLIYLDCDMLILKDVKELFDIDIDDNYLGVTRDIYVIYSAAKNNFTQSDYYCKILGLKKHENYFNAGCMICNMKKMREDNLTEKLIKKLCEIKKPKFVDQCILNAVCHGQVKYIQNNWNYTWHLSLTKDCSTYLPSPYMEYYLSAETEPYIIHFTSGKKPWTDISLPKSYIWWQYARNTPFYEEILYKNFQQQNIDQVKDVINYNKNRLKYWRYKILSKITFGKIRKKYKEKKKTFKNKLYHAGEFLKQ